MKELERGLPHNVHITDVWHKEAPPGVTHRRSGAGSARIHKGPPAVKLSDGRTVVIR